MIYVAVASLGVLVILFYPIIFVLGLTLLVFRKFWIERVKSECEITGVVRRTENENLHNFLQVGYVDEDGGSFDLAEYCQKPNKNIEIIGGARLGKTILAEFLCLRLPELVKIIISFKKFRPENRDFDIGYVWVDVTKHMPDIFDDAESFTSAFRTAFFSELNLVGLTIDTILTRVGDVMEEHPKTFEEFFEILSSISKRGEWQNNITELIRAKVLILQRATRNAKKGNIKFKTNMVLDLGNIVDESAKVFFAEYFLRKINKIEQEEQGEPIRIVIEEAWHLLTSTNQNSILGAILLQGAYYLRVMCITQNYSHLEENYRGHFGTIFCFNNVNDVDVQKIKNGYPDGLIWEGLGQLPDRAFIDLKFRHEKAVVLAWKLNYERIKELKQEARDNSVKVVEDYFTEEKLEESKKVEKQIGVEDDKRIISVLEKSEFCMTAHAITNSLGYIEKDSKRGNIHTRTLPKLVEEGKIRRIDYITATLKPDDKPRNYYYSVPNGESQVHRTIIKDAGKVLDKIKIKYTESQFNQGWDLYASQDFCIDAKSGLQHDVVDDLRKLSEKPIQKVIFVCANYDVKKRYENDFSVVEDIKGRIRVCCLNELENIIKEFFLIG